MYVLNIIERELDVKFRHRYYEKEKRFVLWVDKKANVSGLEKKLKKVDLVLKVLK